MIKLPKRETVQIGPKDRPGSFEAPMYIMRKGRKYRFINNLDARDTKRIKKRKMEVKENNKYVIVIKRNGRALLYASRR